MSLFNHLPNHILQLLAIFLSIIIEALPFVLLGAILSGLIEVFVTPQVVARLLPKQKLLRILFGTTLGFIFPSCECGIVPIVNRFLEKKVPSYTAIPFMATAPVINPVVLFATYSAFGNSWRFVLVRLLGASLVAITLGLLLAFLLDDNILKTSPDQSDTPAALKKHSHDQLNGFSKLFAAFSHAIDDFFEVIGYLILGALFAASMQIFVPTRWLTAIGHTPLLAILLLMAVAFILSLCSEADAFIGASLLSSFGFAPTMAFLLFGPIIDIKNLLIMAKVFNKRFISQFVAISGLVILAYCFLLEVIL